MFVVKQTIAIIFCELPKLLGSYNSKVEESLNRQDYKWLSHEIRNAILKMLAHKVLRNEVANVKQAK